MEMTKYDIKNYLEKIYNVKVVDVRTRIALGETRRVPGKGYVIKDDDIKYAFITLVSNERNYRLNCKLMTLRERTGEVYF